MINFILGVFASIVAAAVFPALVELASSSAVRAFGWLPIRGKVDLSGSWIATWYVTSNRFPSEVTDPHVSVRQLGNRIYARFKNDAMEFQAKGTIDSGRYVTGIWNDQIEGGYHGAFQLIIDPKSREMSGLWIGYSTSGVVKHGKWTWMRQAAFRDVEGEVQQQPEAPQLEVKQSIVSKLTEP